MNYILNSPVVTGPGTFEYELSDVSSARAWVRSNDWTSTVGYDETARVMSEILGVSVPVNRVNILLEPGDEALVFRLVKRLEFSEMKGRLGDDFIRANFEIGIFRRVK